MGSSNTKFVVCNASKQKVKVEPISTKPKTQSSWSLFQTTNTRFLTTENTSENYVAAEVEAGTQFEFNLDESYAGCNVKFIFDKKKELFCQHKKDHGIIISLSDELIYNKNLKMPWIIKSGKHEEIDHLKLWNEWHNKHVEFSGEKEKIKKQYNNIRRGVSIDRKKKHEDVEEEYINEKLLLKQNSKNEMEELEQKYGIENDGEDFTVTVKASSQTNNDTNNTNSKKETIVKALTVMKDIAEKN